MSNVTVIENEAKTPVASSAPMVAEPTRLIEMAISQNADVEKLERLMDLQERWNKDQARKSFYAAMSRFQADCPQIKKHKQGHNYKYAPLCDIVAQIKGLLAECGLSYRFEQDHNNGIRVTCLVSHIDGHSEQTSMQAMPDTSGSKNQVQAIGSTVQYLMRYTLIGALGLTTADEDIDARLPYEPAKETSQPVAAPPDYYEQADFQRMLPNWAKAIQSGKKTPETLITFVESKGRKLTDEQKAQIQGVK